jgi:hypothetical protein
MKNADGPGMAGGGHRCGAGRRRKAPLTRDTGQATTGHVAYRFGLGAATGGRSALVRKKSGEKSWRRAGRQGPQFRSRASDVDPVLGPGTRDRPLQGQNNDGNHAAVDLDRRAAMDDAAGADMLPLDRRRARRPIIVIERDADDAERSVNDARHRRAGETERERLQNEQDRCDRVHGHSSNVRLALRCWSHVRTL